MKKIFRILIIICGGLLLNSCYYDAFPEYDVIDDGTNNDNVSYQSDIVPLFAQCVGCHNGTTPPNLDTNSYSNLLNGYVIANNADASTLYKSLLGIDGVSLMPPGSKWPDSKINLVKNWINQGAKDN